jgi:hypothetical protein
MIRSCSDCLHNSGSKQISNSRGMRRKRWDASNDLNDRCTTSVIARFATVLGVTIAVVAYAVSKVDGFSASNRYQHRIRKSEATKISSIDMRACIPSQYCGPRLLFGRKMSSLAKIPSTQLFLSTKGNKSSDQSEWKAVLAALQLYKAAYGDLRVPMLFVVPSMAPWPGTSRQ